jgi:hypothetical protein
MKIKKKPFCKANWYFKAKLDELAGFGLILPNEV